jgi:hypothetical protein
VDQYGDWEGIRTGPVLVVKGEQGTVSQFPPGAALTAAPFSLIWPGKPEIWEPGDPRRVDDVNLDLEVPPLGPAALTAALTTALGVALAGLAARPLIGGFAALVGIYLFGLGTGAWAVAADALWQHGPDLLWITLGIWLASKNREWLSGLAFGMAILTRPPTAIVAAAVGLALAWKARSMMPAWRIAAGSALGLVALIGYNAAVFDSGSISGGYGDGAVSNTRDTDLIGYLNNIRGGLLDPTRGLITLSPLLLPVSVGLVALRKRIPPALLGGAIGGVLYLLLQWKANRFSGGSNFVGYRYPIEALAATAPALFVGWNWVKRYRLARLLLFVTAAYSLALYASFTL